MKNYRINFIRHGITEANLKGWYVGRTDYELCPEGIRELINLRENSLYPLAQRVYCSPLSRCVQTAGILYPDHDLEIMDQLIELDFGDFEGQTFAQLREREDFQQWMGDAFRNAPTGGESGEELTLRTMEGLEQIFREMMNEGLTEVTVVTHGGVIMNLMFALGLPKGAFGDYYVQNGQGYSVVMTPQMWMRDHAFEICGTIPVPKDYEGADGLPPKDESDLDSVPLPGALTWEEQ